MKKSKTANVSLQVAISLSELAIIALFIVCIAYINDHVSHEESAYVLNEKIKETKAKLEDIKKLFQNQEDELIEIEYKLKSAEKNIDIKNKILEEKDELLASLEEIVNNFKNQSKSISSNINQNASQISDVKPKDYNIKSENVEKSIDDIENSELHIRKELIGLSGELKNVVFVFDRSKSIRNSGRWTQAVNLLNTWISALEVNKIGVVVYGDTVDVFNDYKLLSLQQTDEEMLVIQDWLNSRKSESGTNLMLGLSSAYQYKNVDTIVLFTDGRVWLYQKNKILSFLKEKTREDNIPINVIGIGDYFKKSPSKFLIKISELSGGSFHGY